MTSIASSSQRSYPSELPTLPPYHYGVFRGTLQKPHLQLLGGLLFCVGLTLSKPAWSAPQAGSAALSVPPPNPNESVVTTTSTEAIPSHSTKQGTGKGERGTQWSSSFLSSPPECMEYSKLERCSGNSESPSGLKSKAHSSTPLQWTEAFVELGVHPLPFRNGYSALREPVKPVPNAEQKNTEVQEFSSSVSIGTFGTTGVGGTNQEFISQFSGELKDSVVPFQAGLEFSSERMSEKLLTHLPSGDPPKSPLKRGTLSGSVPSLQRGTLSGSVSPVISKVQPPLTPPLLTGALVIAKRDAVWRARGNRTLSTTSETSSETNSELLVQSQSFPSENNSESERTTNSEDPELGILRLRELPTPPPPAKPSVYLLGGAGYFRSNNIFSAFDPVDDGLFKTGVTLLAVPSLGPQTSLFASVGGNIIRYSDLSDYNYDELRFSAGIRQQIGSRTYGELGWLNRQLFSEEGGDRFLNDHSVYLELGRRDPLTRQLALDTYYQLRLSFANPSDRSQVINSLGASLAYYPFPALEAALDYQFALADFTQQERDDQYHQLIARLTYTLSRNSRFYLFGGRSFGDSSDEYTDFDGWVFGAGVDLNLVLF